MSTYLVTGGAGFIGSHLVERLLELRHRVFILDNFSTGSLENVQHLIHDDRLEVVRGTTSNLALVNRMVEQVDVIYHLAATVGVMKVMEQPAEVIENNVGRHQCGAEGSPAQSDQNRDCVHVRSLWQERGRAFS